MNDWKEIVFVNQQKEIMEEFYSLKPKKIVSDIKEISYSRTYANMLNLVFVDLSAEPDFISLGLRDFFDYFGCFSDYIYSSKDRQRLLVPISYCDSVDYVLVNTEPLDFFTVKFKENLSKIKLPKQFKTKIYNDEFYKALTKYYVDNFRRTKPFSDFFCTEDKNRFLVMFPINQVGLWIKKIFQGDLDYEEVKRHYKDMF